MLIRAGADVNEVSEGGFTPIMLAPMMGSELIQPLLDEGADVKTRDDMGYNTFLYAT